MKRLSRLLAVLVLIVGCLGWTGHHSALAANLNVMQYGVTSGILATEMPRRNRVDDKMAKVRNKLDLNNSDLRDFRQYKGMFPKLGSLIILNAPYDSVEDVLKISGLTEQQKEILQQNLENFTVTPPESVFIEGDQRLNVGAYD
ncbi:photosystem II complex extrinsic protein PsbU [Planktothrix sp. FACHB-1365]|uniref:photosystem II complex extrinsic protein PsbU n=1 Tax=Planktothrix sp. FACHB-1365 TaxID=2692855 RepID=UPI001689300A|nr:photosystem II complex extrinsic protein PsbU [Planktothrix sp. FACHB-1365]MBD2480698.1 photosystem II complex extrinsic protein PsbU [Planktothrix sp. FACHB-1365]